MTNGSERPGLGTRLHVCLRVLAVLVGRLRPELYSGPDARRLTELFAWGEKLCATGKALTAQRVADTGAWESSGERSVADWLARVSGQTTGQAAQALETVRRLADLPDVEAAARAGKLSAAQNTAVTAAAAKAPEKTSELLDKAEEDSLTGLRERAQEIRLAAATEASEKARYRAIHAGRYVRTWTDLDGSGRLSGRFTPDALAEIVSAMAPFQQEVFDTARAAGTRERRECHAADALVAMARTATGQDPPPPAGDGGPSGGGSGHEDESTPAGDPMRDDKPQPDCDPDPGPPGAGDGNSPTRARRPAMVIVRIDHAALVRGYRCADECCEIAGIGLVPVATVKAMMADAFLAAVVTDGTDIRSVVHMGRDATARQTTALLVRDPECVVPGCHIQSGLEIDHVDGWSQTKVTTIDALARLCRHHHDQKTYDGWQLHGPPGHWQWISPDDASPLAPADASGRPPRRAPDPPPSTQSLFDTSEDPFPP